MLALFSLLWAAMHVRAGPDASDAVKAFRITVSLLTMVVMGVVVFWRQRLLRDETFALSRKVAPLIRRPQGLAGKAHSIGEAGLARPVGGRSRARDQQPADRHAGILRPAQRIQLATRRTTSRPRTSASRSAAPRRWWRACLPLPVKLRQNWLRSTSTPCCKPPRACSLPNWRRTPVRSVSNLRASLPLVLADSNQILHVCMHLAGQISARLNRENPPHPVRSHA